MKSEQIRRAIGGIDDDLIEAAERTSRKNPAPAWKKWSAAAAALVLLLGAAFLMRGVFAKNQLPVTSEGGSRTEENRPNREESAENSDGREDPAQDPPASSAPQSDQAPIIWASSGLDATNEGFTQWKDKKYVTYRLYEALGNAQGGEGFAIRIHVIPDETFVFEGKTLGEYYLEMAEERNLPEKLAQLLKEGEDLKYGDKLWQEGNAEGIKWYKEFYEERVAWYGEELLANYIVNGEFLVEKLESDREKSLGADAATRAYETAKDAFLQGVCQSVHGWRPSELCEYDRIGIVVFMTQEEFETLECGYPHFEDWAYDLACAAWDGDEEVIRADPERDALYGVEE